MKPGIRILGIDDGAFEFEDSQTYLTGVVYRGTEFIEDIVATRVEVDGYDATEKVLELYRSCQNQTQIKALMVDGVSFAGFNVVDIHQVAAETGKPVIAVTSNRPDMESFRQTMERTGNRDESFDRLDEPEEVELKDGTVYVQFAGTDLEDTGSYIENSTIHGLTPEPVRVAHMIGRAFHDPDTD